MSGEPEEGKALWIPSPNCWPNRNGHTPLYVILHGTASPGAFYAQDIAHYFQDSKNEASSHYVVGRDGAIVQCVSEHDAAWGNGIILDGATKKADSWWSKNLNPNYITISIEHVNPDPQNATALTSIQQQASSQLIKDICKRWNIPMRPADGSGGIAGHYSIDSLDRFNCPGNYPWDELWRSLKENNVIDLSNPTVANYFVLWQGNWRCKQKTNDGVAPVDNHVIKGEILQFYQAMGGLGWNGLTFLGLPLEDDHTIPDPSGKAYPQILEQRFERGIVRYDPGHVLDQPPGSGTCYLTHVDTFYGDSKKMQIVSQENEQLKQQIKALNDQILQEKKAIDPSQISISDSSIVAVAEKVSQDVLIKLEQIIGTKGTQQSSQENTA